VIVTDTNLVSCLVVRNDHSELAAEVYEADPVWVAPLLWRSEFRNALAKYILHGGMSLDAALAALRSAEEIVAGREYRVSSEHVLELVVQSKCSAYDCEFVALALDLDVPLVTADKQLLKAFPKTAVALERFTKQK
jgi:predicted nucleic acid-binding protein